MARKGECLTAVRSGRSVVCSNWLDESHAESAHRVYMQLVDNLLSLISDFCNVVCTGKTLFDTTSLDAPMLKIYTMFSTSG